MKMKIFALLLVAIISVLTLAACGEEACEHTFAEKWSSDKNKHWHQATCEHGEIKDSLAEHTDVDEDGKCDVCEYEVGHDHTFSAKWTYDEENHWKKATCTHIDEKKDLDLHSDEDDNGVCDVCKGHVHSVNAAGYCKHESCGDKLEDVDEVDLEAIVNAILVQKNKVNRVNIGYVFDGPSDNEDYFNDKAQCWDSYNSHTEKQITVVFGKDNYVYNNTITNNRMGYQISEDKYSSGYRTNSGTFESWIQLMGPENVFGVYKEDANDIALGVFSADDLLGYYYTISTAANSHGTENLLYSLFEATKAEGAKNLVVSYDAENNNVSFSFGLLVVQVTTVGAGGYNPEFSDDVPEYDGETETIYNANYYELAVRFSYTNEFVLTNLDVACNAYTNDAGALFNNDSNLLDVSIQYDPATNTFKFVEYDVSSEKFVETTTPDCVTYTYHITQTVGERTAENENPQSKFVPESFGIFTTEERTTAFGNSITMSHGSYKYIYLGDYKPAGTSLDIAPEFVTYQIIDANGNVLDNTDAMNLPKDEDGNTIGSVSEDFRSFYSYNENGRHIFIMPKTAGTYTVVIYLQGVELHRITVTAT